MRLVIALVAATGLAAVASSGCGGKFPLPTENLAARRIPSDKSYEMSATWRGLAGIRDILLTPNGQLFLLRNSGGTGTSPRGRVDSYQRLSSVPVRNGIGLGGLFNPVALCVGGDGAGLPANQIYVLDQGDTCLARAGMWVRGTSGRDSCINHNDSRITNLDLYWHMRQYDLLGVPKDSFTDTSFAFVNGIAADAQGRVYISGLAIVLVPRDDNPSIINRSHLWRIQRYLRGPRYPGNHFDDPYMPGANWHRDTTWFVGDGNGIGTVIDPRGIYWNSYAGGRLYVADNRKNVVQTLSDQVTSLGFIRIPPLPPAPESELLLDNPEDVSADAQGFIYVTDTGHHHVNRYNAMGEFVQRVDVKVDADRDSLHVPVTVAADDSLAYVGDAATGKVIRYQRLP